MQEYIYHTCTYNPGNSKYRRTYIKLVRFRICEHVNCDISWSGLCLRKVHNIAFYKRINILINESRIKDRLPLSNSWLTVMLPLYLLRV